MLIQGVIPILQTPFLASGELDLDSLGREVRCVCDAGADGLAFPGFASEWWKLSDDEIFRAAEAIIAERPDSVKIIFNVTAQSTYSAVRQAKRFVALGCDALMCLPPFVVASGAEAKLTHMRKVMEAAEVPHIIQYAASLTGTSFEPSEFAALKRDFPHFSSIKVDFIPPGPVISRLVDVLGRDQFTYIVGFSGLQLADALDRGAHGLMGGSGHVATDVAVYRALKSGDPERARRAFETLLPMLNFEMQTIDLVIAVHKRLLHDQGVFTSEHVREPGVALDAHQLAELRRHFNSIEVLRDDLG